MSTPANLPGLESGPPPFNPPVEPKELLDDFEVESPWDELQEDAPAWMISVLFHAIIIILLGLLSVGVEQHLADPLELNVLSTYSPANDQLDESFNSDLSEIEPEQLIDEFEVVPSSASSDLPSDEVLLAGAVADLAADWQKMIASADESASLVPGATRGTGEGSQGSGAGIRAVMDKTSFFGLSGEGGKFVYVFDRSDSMNTMLTRYSEGIVLGTIVPLEAAKAELKRSLSTLSLASKFQIVFYNHTVETLGKGNHNDKLLHATPQNKELAFNSIDKMPGLGSTDHRIALDAGVAFEPDVVFLLTDAQPHDDLTPDVAMQVIKYCKRHRIKLNVVHFSDTPRPDSTMVRMAEGTGGKHVFLDLKHYANSVDVADLIKAL